MIYLISNKLLSSNVINIIYKTQKNIFENKWFNNHVLTKKNEFG